MSTEPAHPLIFSIAITFGLTPLARSISALACCFDGVVVVLAPTIKQWNALLGGGAGKTQATIRSTIFVTTRANIAIPVQHERLQNVIPLRTVPKHEPFFYGNGLEGSNYY